MMRGTASAALAAALFSLLLAGCKEDVASAAKPPPQEPTATSVAYFCSMGVFEHGGPKGQIFRAGKSEPIWFGSVRDAIAFTMLPEEPKDVVAIYVNDMARAKNWDKPEAGDWVDARKAWYVIASDYSGGMGGNEAVPFSEEKAAGDFAKAHGGTVTRFDKLPEKYILETAASDAGTDTPVGEAAGSAVR